MISLAIETSCDETSAAILDDDQVLSNIIHSQLFHSKYGGVIPEVASRHHLNKIIEVTEEALKKADKVINEIELISATSEPGLIGALLVGLNFGKSLAMSLNIPFVPVNHIHSHLYSNFLEGQPTSFPFMALIVSGGHTLLVLVEDFFKHKIIGKTIDDAAGEAFDKVAKLLGLGYPGGPTVNNLAEFGDKNFHKFPLANVKGNEFDFSFSGIKTSVLYFLRKINFEENKNAILINNICASFQDAMVQTLFQKTYSAAKKYKINKISISGGVAANSDLQKAFYSLKNENFNIFIPRIEYSSDNAAMIGLVGFYKYILANNKNCFQNNSFKWYARARLDYASF